MRPAVRALLHELDAALASDKVSQDVGHFPPARQLLPQEPTV